MPVGAWREKFDRAGALATATDAQTIALHVTEVNKLPENAATAIVFVSEEQVQDDSFGLSQLGSLLPSGYQLSPVLKEDFKGKGGSTYVLYPSTSDGKGASRVVLVGLGKADKVHLNALRVATSKAIKLVQEKKVMSNVAFFLPTTAVKHPSTHGLSVPNVSKDSVASTEEVLDAVTRIIVLANHQWDKYLKSDDEEKQEDRKEGKAINTTAIVQANKAISLGKPYIKDLTIVTPKAVSTGEDIVQRARIITEGTILARELGNERSEVITTEYMEETARALAKAHGLKFSVKSHDELIAEGYNLITAVGQAAKHKSRIVVLEYNGNPGGKDDTIAFVGKGICLDTGGLNLKPTGSMEQMHLDMSGSAAVLSTMKAIAQLKLKVNVIGALALAENVIGSLAVKPWAIVPTHKGSVQIDNTDAEGRLALADAMTYVQQHYKPQQLQTIATLTGAIILALGHDYAGVFTTDDTIAQDLQSAGYRTHEHLWRLPLVHEHHAENMKNEYSDLKTTGGRANGSAFAASFLSKFIDEPVRFAHLDIAGVQLQPKARLWHGSGGPGYGVQLWIDYLEHHKPAAAGQ